MVDKTDVIIAVWDGTASGMIVNHVISYQNHVLVIASNLLMKMFVFAERI
jgi:hypothetical protein